MNKKFISAFMLGLLTLGATSTITSCKDYDGDISNLQGQIDKLASKEELASKIAELQGQIAAAKTEASNALTAAKAAQATADTKADKADLKDLQTKVADLVAEVAKKADKTEVEALLALKADKTEVAEAVKALQDKDAEIAQALADAIEAQKLIDDGQDSKITEALEAAKKNADAIVKLEKDLTEDIEDHETRLKEIASTLKATQEALGDVQVLAAKNAEAIASLKDTKADKATVDALADLVGAEAVSVQIEKANAALMTNLYTQEEIKALISQIELKLMEAYSTMVTAVNLFTTVEDHLWGPYDHTLTFGYAKELANEFGKGVVADDQIIKTEDGKFVTTGDEVVVRVSPASAILKAENVGLVNSQGANLDEYLDVEVKPYTELLSRSTQPTGLWVVSYKLKKDYDAEGFAKAIETTVNNQTQSVIFAVSVKNDNEKVQAGRVVVSEFDLTAETEEANNALSDFKANDICVSNIRNRFDYDKDIYQATSYKELAWVNKTAVKPTIVLKDGDIDPDKSDVKVDYADYRWDMPYLMADVDEDIVIDFNCDANASHNIRGFYVVLDYQNAMESAPSELEAWNSYTYENVGKLDKDGKVLEKATMFEGKKGTIKVTKMNATNDAIGFRVYAVNQNGTLVDPDGKAFYVKVGKSAAEDKTIDAGNITANKDYTKSTVYVKLGDEFKNITFDQIVTMYNGNEYATWSATNKSINAYAEKDKAEYCAPFRIDFCSANNKIADKKANEANFLKVTFGTDAYRYIDNETYTIVLKLKNSQIANKDVRTVTINVKKVMPTAVPALEFIEGHTQDIFVGTTENWTDANNLVVNGNVDQAFKLNFSEIYYETGKGKLPAWTINEPCWQNFAVSAADKDAKNNVIAKNAEEYIFTSGTKIKAGALVDGKTVHEVATKYTYGKISKVYDEETESYITRNYVLDGAAPSIIFHCWSEKLDKELKPVKTVAKDQKYTIGDEKYADDPIKIAWNADVKEISLSSLLAIVDGVNTGVNSNTFDKIVKYTNLSDDTKVEVKTATQTSNWFTAKVIGGNIALVKKDNQKGPSVDVNETVSFKVKDAFGHEMTLSFPITVTTK